MDKINGVLLTGGAEDLYDKKNEPTIYLKVVEYIIEYSKQKFKSWEIFPVIGTC